MTDCHLQLQIINSQICVVAGRSSNDFKYKLEYWRRCEVLTSRPGHPTASGETPTLDSIDSYMKKLHSIIVGSPQENEHLINTVRDVVNRLDR